jgi:hypothetical protein
LCALTSRPSNIRAGLLIQPPHPAIRSGFVRFEMIFRPFLYSYHLDTPRMPHEFVIWPCSHMEATLLRMNLC